MDWKQGLYVLDSCFLSGSTCTSKPSFVLVKLDSRIPQILLSAGATWSSYSSIVKRPAKTEAGAAKDKAERGLASPTFLLTHYVILNIIKRTTQPNTQLVPCWYKKKKRKKNENGWVPKQRAKGGGCEESSLCLCWAARQWETRGTQSVFSFY